jgi:mono/diheme cytochrome c family protein
MPSAFTRIAASLTLILVVCSTEVWAQEPAARGGAYFTAAQAEQGRDVYSSECASCHGEALDDGVAPPLAGDQFVLSWGRAGRTLDDLFFITRTTMPEGEGGTLSEEQYLDVLAYMLHRNGYSAGDRALTADAADLTALTIESQDGAASDERSTRTFIRGPRGLVPEATRSHTGRSECGRRKQ